MWGLTFFNNNKITFQIQYNICSAFIHNKILLDVGTKTELHFSCVMLHVFFNTHGKAGPFIRPGEIKENLKFVIGKSPVMKPTG